MSCTLHGILTPADLPQRRFVSAVFLVAITAGRILATRNERGWDIPGGHLEQGESLLTGLRREVLEEAGARLDQAIPFATLATPASPQVMLFFAAGAFELQELVLAPDVFERAEMEIDDFLNHYYGDQTLMRRLIELAAQRLAQSSDNLAARPGRQA